MTRPLRENLEIVDSGDERWIQCSNCHHRLSGENQDWRDNCIVKRLSPGHMGPHRELLEGKYILEERYCPNCGITLDADVIQYGSHAGISIAEHERDQGRDSPRRVSTVPVELSSDTAAVVVLDVNVGVENPEHPAWPILASCRQFLDRARKARVPIIYTVVVWDKGTPHGQVAKALDRRDDEPVLYPDGYDKFIGGDLRALLDRSSGRDLVLIGGAANFALLYTATTAARAHRYNVIVPVDGLYAHSTYEMGYALHQLSVLPRVRAQFRFTQLALIDFLQGE